MSKFVKFKDWESSKNSSTAVQEDAENVTTGNAELLAQIADLTAKRKTHVKNSEDFEAQILEIEIKILKLEVEQNELEEKKKQLTGAKEISSKRRVEGKTNEQ
jgi:hypothetical protein